MLHLLLTLMQKLISSPVVAAWVAWLGRLATRLLARQLQMPEALVHHAGLYVYARIDVFERRLLQRLVSAVLEK